MTQSSTFSHHRRSLSGPNASKLRTARPALHRKGTSFANHSISKLGSGQVKIVEPVDDCQPEMAASFLNFCAMCERQITVPDNTLLYCSESCRRKDSHKPLSASYSSKSSMSSSISPPTSPPMSPRIIVAPLTPTKAPMDPTRGPRIPTDMIDAKTDLDPTEWKPVIPTDSRCVNLMSSEAWKYLSQFHNDETILPVRRPKVDLRSSASLSTMMSAMTPLPSLSHTPSTAASSLSSDGSDYMSYTHELAHRPLPPRHNPYFSSSASATKGVELVVPHVHSGMKVAPVDISTRGSIFPANSSLWDDNYADKVPITIATFNPAGSGSELTEK